MDSCHERRHDLLAQCKEIALGYILSEILSPETDCKHLLIAWKSDLSPGDLGEDKAPLQRQILPVVPLKCCLEFW